MGVCQLKMERAKLTEDTLLIIASFLSHRHLLLSFAPCNKKCHGISHHPSLWQYVQLEDASILDYVYHKNQVKKLVIKNADTIVRTSLMAFENVYNLTIHHARLYESTKSLSILCEFASNIALRRLSFSVSEAASTDKDLVTKLFSYLIPSLTALDLRFEEEYVHAIEMNWLPHVLQMNKLSSLKLSYLSLHAVEKMIPIIPHLEEIKFRIISNGDYKEKNAWNQLISNVKHVKKLTVRGDCQDIQLPLSIAEKMTTIRGCNIAGVEAFSNLIKLQLSTSMYQLLKVLPYLPKLKVIHAHLHGEQNWDVHEMPKTKHPLISKLCITGDHKLFSLQVLFLASIFSGVVYLSVPVNIDTTNEGIQLLHALQSLSRLAKLNLHVQLPLDVNQYEQVGHFAMKLRHLNLVVECGLESIIHLQWLQTLVSASAQYLHHLSIRLKKVFPHAPIRPLSPQSIFQLETRPLVLAQYPTSTAEAHDTILANMWKHISAEEQKHYEERSQQQHERYDMELQDYYQRMHDIHNEMDIESMMERYDTDEEELEGENLKEASDYGGQKGSAYRASPVFDKLVQEIANSCLHLKRFEIVSYGTFNPSIIHNLLQNNKNLQVFHLAAANAQTPDILPYLHDGLRVICLRQPRDVVDDYTTDEFIEDFIERCKSKLRVLWFQIGMPNVHAALVTSILKKSTKLQGLLVSKWKGPISIDPSQIDSFIFCKLHQCMVVGLEPSVGWRTFDHERTLWMDRFFKRKT